MQTFELLQKLVLESEEDLKKGFGGNKAAKVRSRKKMQEIKKIFPEETRLNLAADAEIPFYVIVNTMDATRENIYERTEGKSNPLFYDVILAAGL